MAIQVKKRNGSLEPLNIDKVHKMTQEACEGLSGVSSSQVEMNSGIQFYDGISTKEIQDILIRSASDLISLEGYNYQYVSARLLLFALRKEVMGQFEYCSLQEMIDKNIKVGVYDKEFLKWYSKRDIEKLNSYIKHQRDLDFTYAGLRQVVDKYLVQDRSSGEVYETPQFMYMMIAATLFAQYPKDTRLQYVKQYYDAVSQHKINIPTPVMAGVRTPIRQFASCVLVDSDDTLQSIFSSDMAIGYYTAQRAGIGINAGRIRSIGSKIRGGEIQHTGVVPFLKKFEATVRSCTQNGVRGGSATTHFPIWHSEIEDILVLKNNKGSEDNRVRRLDYSIQLSKLFYQRFIEDKHITLFSPHDVPGLYDAFGTERFDDLYKKYERSRTVNKKKVKARELFMSLLRERAETGRIYIMNIDHANEHSSFLDKVNMSNLCVAPETKILTKTGYIPISELENKVVSIWNGLQWSDVGVVRTGTDQKLIDVVIGDNFVITCTPYHKFYTVKSADDWNARRVEEKRACDLTSEDNITKFYCPFIEKGDITMDDAYERGYASMRGDKFVPINNHSLDTRLKWLAGLLDAEGAMEKRSGNISFNVYSTYIDFLREVALLLQTLGCLSTIKKVEEEQFVQFPESNSKGYLFPAKYRLTVLADDTYHKLSNLGLFSHTKVAKYNKPRLLSKRRRDNLYRVKEVRDLGRVDDTYCFTEPKRNMGMFNGCIAGNCQEITLPTKPIQHIDDEKGEIALCILSAINLGKIKDKQELEPLCDIAVRALEEIIDFQGYPVKAAELSTKARRSLGIGYIGVAHYLAKNKVKYDSQESWQLMHDITEVFQYYLIKASVNLARERGPCEKFNRTKYSQGILPIDTYKREVDEIIADPSLKMDWELLRQEILEHGMRHSTLTAQMPSESSSVVSNATNGIEPPRGYLSIKKSKKGPLKQIVPGYYHFRNYYSLLWDLPNNEGYINIVAVMQKFFDQAISGNWSYNPEHYPNNEIPMSVMARDLLTTYKLGWKTSYYHNTYDAKKDEDEELPPLEQTNIQEESEEDCESCTI